MDRGAWWATAHRVTQSWTRLKQQSSSNIRKHTAMRGKRKVSILSRMFEDFMRISNFKDSEI